ncbi:zinc finger, CCHC-type containing protein [Tanacetum coccineum]
MDESFQVLCIIDKLPLSWKDFKHTLKHLKEELTLVELGSHLCIKESLRVQDNDKPKGSIVAGPSVVNMVEHNNSSRYNDNKGKCKHHDTKVDPNKKQKVTCWKCGKPGQLKKDCKAGNVGNKANGSSTKGLGDGSSNSLKADSGATMHVCKDRCWFKTYESLNDGSILHMGNKSTALVHGRGCVDLRLNIVSDNIGSAFMSTSKLNDSIIWHARLGHVHFKRMQDMSKDRFSLVPRPSQRSLVKGTEDSGGSVVPKKVTEEVVQQPEPELRKSKRHRTLKDFGPEFQLYLIKGRRDEVSGQHSYCFNVEDDLKKFDESMKSHDVAFWKEAINDEMDFIMGNNTWVSADLPPGCKPLGCKWIFKRKLKVDGTVEKFKVRLVIQGFKQKSRIDYFDTYAPVARISTIRLLIAMTSINSLIIHQMDVKTTFLNGKLEEDVYMNQPQGFIMSGNENKVCKLIKSLYGLKQEPKQWHQKFDKVVLSNGCLLNQADKCVYSKFDEFGKGVIICLYVDDMLIFGTDQVQVDLTKKFLSSRFSMKDMGEADVISGIRIKHESNGIAISQSHYIEKLSILRYTINPAGKANNEDNSSKTWLGIPCLVVVQILRLSRSKNYITGSTMEYEFVALAAAGKEAEWLKNLLLEILVWVKPIAPISIRCDSASILEKAYSQMYNGKSRHLGVRHSMIRKLIMNGVVSIEFVRSQQNLADHLTKGLARDLVIKSAEGM